MTILEKIKLNSANHPERVVMRTQYDFGEMTMKWGELDTFSDRLAYYLTKELKTHRPIIVYGHKHPMMLVCFLACVKAGRAYCPVDVNVPLSRTEAIIQEVEPEIILTTESLGIDSNRIKNLEEITEIVSVEGGNVDCSNYVTADDVFYIIFTSGSTGTPKGVQITRDCLDNFIKWAIHLGGDAKHEEGYTFMNQAPFSFDLSVMDLYLCLYTGGSLFAIEKGVQSDMKHLYETLSKSGINIWVSTPSFADVCLSDPIFSDNILPGLRAFLFCGEILTNKTVNRLRQRFPTAKIVNTYGPTESTCAVTEINVTDEINEKYSPLPVGRPKNGTWIRIVDEDGNEMGEGRRGEIIIVGDSVSIGYWNNAEKNKKTFGLTTVNGREYRFYRTGDEGYMIDGMLYYCGRIDNQVKLHGYRIELEDIESNLLKIHGIIQAVVLPKYRDNKVTSLMAGVVLSEKLDDEKAAVEYIKSNLKKTLPEYMIPKKIKFLSDIPRTNNGKIDRKALGGIL